MLPFLFMFSNLRDYSASLSIDKALFQKGKFSLHWSDKVLLFDYFWVVSLNRAIGLMSRVFANGLGGQGSILGRVIPKTQKNGTWCCLA